MKKKKLIKLEKVYSGRLGVYCGGKLTILEQKYFEVDEEQKKELSHFIEKGWLKEC